VQAQIVTLNEVQPHWIPLKSRVVLDSLRARMSSQYQCGTETPEMGHMIYAVHIPDRNGEMQHVRALIDCAVGSFFLAPRVLKRLGILHETAHSTFFGPNGGVMHHVKNSRNMRITVQYLDHQTPLDELDVLVVPMRVYDLVLGLPWFHKRHPHIDWACCQLTSPRSPSASGAEEMTPMTTAVALTA
jgi:hypothetical protein